MPKIEFSDEEFAAVRAALRRSIADDKYPLSPRLAPLALAKLASPTITQPRPPLAPLPQVGPTRGAGSKSR